MKPCFSHWPSLARRLVRAPRILLALDYDGVLTPITRNPGQAVLSKPMKDVLRKLIHLPDVHVAVVSGRALADLERKISLPGVVCAGNHGMDIRLPGRRERRGASQTYRRALVAARRRLAGLIQAFPGSQIEDKGLGFILHYRQVPARRRGLLIRRFRSWRKGLPRTLRVSAQKMAFDFTPNVRWDKGRAALRIWDWVGCAALPVFLGDDRTDEDAFRALRRKGVTVFVGSPRPSLADYYVRSPQDVLRLLRRIHDLRAPFVPHSP